MGVYEIAFTVIKTVVLSDNGWQYGKWRFADCIPIHREKSLIRTKTPELPISPPFAILRVVLRCYF